MDSRRTDPHRRVEADGVRARQNWGYSHTNYVILGRVLEKIAGMPLADAIRQDVLVPMGLTQTSASTTPAIPAPVLHTFTSERRESLGVKAGVPFYEEATYWNPSWTTIEGAVETTDISDLSLSLEAVGTGKAALASVVRRADRPQHYRTRSRPTGL